MLTDKILWSDETGLRLLAELQKCREYVLIVGVADTLLSGRMPSNGDDLSCKSEEWMGLELAQRREKHSSPAGRCPVGPVVQQHVQ